MVSDSQAAKTINYRKVPGDGFENVRSQFYNEQLAGCGKNTLLSSFVNNLFTKIKTLLGTRVQ